MHTPTPESEASSTSGQVISLTTDAIQENAGTDPVSTITITTDTPLSPETDTSADAPTDPPLITSFYPTTYFSQATSVLTQTATVSSVPQNPDTDNNSQIAILVVVILSSIGIVFALSAIILCWLKRGEGRGRIRNMRNMRELEDDSMHVLDNQYDEQLPSYAEAVVRGRVSVVSVVSVHE